MTTELATIIAAIAGIVALVALGLVGWMNRAPSASRHTSEALPLFGSEVDQSGRYLSGDRDRMAAAPPIDHGPEPVSSRPAPQPPGAAGAAQARRGTRQTPARARPKAPSADPAPTPRAPDDAPGRATRPAPTIRTFTTSGRQAPVEGPERFAPPAAQTETHPVPKSSEVVAHGVPGTMVEGHLLRYSVPAEGTLQFLPGRLEVAEGMDRGREFRFVHVPGPNGTEVTFGRSEGELYRHIQLRHQTVSRTHARMRLEHGNWLLLNLSNTNPVVYNGKVLSNGEEQTLSDGDRIEMGEVLFTFRSR